VRHIKAISAICLCLAALTAQAAHTQAKLVLSMDACYPDPGGRVAALVDLKMEPGWHTYWKNPGASGMATKIEWQLPTNVTTAGSGWPVPKKFPPAEVTTYGYEDEVVLPAILEVASNSPPGQVKIKAHVTWLECNEVCIPGSADVEATLHIANPDEKIKTGAENLAADPERARVVHLWRHSVPLPQKELESDVRAWWEKSTNDDMRPFVIECAGTEHQVDFYPDTNDHYVIQDATEMIATKDGNVGLRKLVKKIDGDWPKEISGLLVSPRGANAPIPTNSFRNIYGWEVTLPVSETAPTNELIGSGPIPPNPVGILLFCSNWNDLLFLGKFLLYAFIGGLILNVMPCVLPVIALKILGFVSEARSEPRRVRKLGLFYALGVLVSFLALAAVVNGVKIAGHKAGWGMQFGSPVFIVCLTTLVLLVALNLFGAFEVSLGGRAMNAADKLASKHGTTGAFFNGVLATALATPCTAPFLSVALGFAFAQEASVIVVAFLAVGVGLAAPYVLLSWNPAWLKFLPKPGPWMEKFKIVMGFPMLATAVWLFNLAAGNYGRRVLWLGIFLVAVALAAWVFGRFFQRGRTRRGLALVIALILLIGGYVYALESQLHWRAPLVVADTTVPIKNPAGGIDWQRWSPEAVAKARSEGHPVLVDFTADWCLTCQVNKKTSIEIPSVRSKLKEINAITLLGDYTHFPDAITAELNRYNRAGVPLVLVYPKNADAPPIVLSEILTPGIVLDALDRASR
jgi:thiol:disulfide interchange protein/DsbC/DsbD-like thiol-disulfide interchange protein